MNAAAPVTAVRKCNVCKGTYPWTLEYFDEKRNGELTKCCRRCLDKHFRKGPAPAPSVPRLSYWVQPNHLRESEL